ncbi:MurR/RpiR family transcriptional regulator [Inquilinus limosus]|uniref:MurR/RpiR family transcriptional regulator n=1 Tax=Inquilinus limosus TaxID=171674 RepID=UPI00047CD3B4|nr:MurR/RpiR family transcriptional regulator [Inquilinus limosus]
MDQGPLADRIVERFDAMPAQLQAAARYVLDRPRDVALLSMREQARQAGVPPATMTRLAKRLGLDGYDSVRALYAEAVRTGDIGFAGRADAQLASQTLKGDRALAAEIATTVAGHIARLAEPAALDRLTAAAARLAAARRIYCLGLRAGHAVAWHLHYVLSLLGERTVLLDAAGATGTDPIRAATPEDVLLAASVSPYTRATVETARWAAARGVAVVAVTDSEVSPLAQAAAETILVATDSPSFFHSLAPGFVAAEILAALVAGRGTDAPAALRRTEAQLAAFDTHLRPRIAKAQP